MPHCQQPEAHALRSVAEIGKAMGGAVGQNGTSEGARAESHANLTSTSAWRFGVWPYALLLTLLVFAAFPGVVLGTGTFVFRDFGLFSYPVAQFQRESFWHGEVPLWNPLSYCGVPFLAQWNTMCLYPPALFYLVLPLSWALPMFCLLHLVWGALGMYLLTRRWTGHELAGALAGVVFAFNGLSLNFLMWPSHIATLSWLPWVIWLGQRAWQEGGRALVWAIAVASLQMLAGGPETIAVTWLLLGLFLLLDLFAVTNWVQRLERGRAETRPSYVPALVSQPRVIAVARFAAMGAVVALICAAQLLPFLELLGHSQRDSAYSSTAHNWSMPMWGWANFLVPLFRMIPTAQGVYMQPGQYWTSSYYVGIATVPLAAIAVWRVRDWRVRCLAGLVYVSLVLAWGDTSVLYSALRWCIPALGFFRYPVKFVLPVVAVAPMLAAFGFSAFMKRGKSRRFEMGSLVLTLVALGLVAVLGSADGSEVAGVVWQNAVVRGALLLAIAVVGAWLVGNRAVTERTVAWHKLAMFAFLGLFWLDFRSHVPNQNPTVSPEVYAADWAGALANNQAYTLGQGRVMLNPADREALNHNFLADPTQNYRRNRAAELSNCNLLDGIAQVDGFFSLVPRESFRVTQLPYEQSGRDWNSLLDLMGVSAETAPDRSLVWRKRDTALPLITAGQEPIYVDEETALRALSETNAVLRQEVFLPVQAREAIAGAREPLARVRNAQFANGKMSFETDSPRPCLVTIAQSYYPGWRAYVDGKQTGLWRANFAFQALKAPAGRHRVQLRYVDRAFNWGVVLSLMGGGVWLVLLLQSGSTKAKLPAKPY